jgi:small GTP-binding protein
MISWILTNGTEKIVTFRNGDLGIDEKVIAKALSVIVGKIPNSSKLFRVDMPTSTMYYQRINSEHILFIVSRKSIDESRIFPVFETIIESGQNSQDNIESLTEFINNIIDGIKTKVLLMGFGGVGKTTIRSLIREKNIPLIHDPTIGVEVVQLADDAILWDTAGQIGFLKLLPMYLKGSDLVIVVSDSSLENALHTKKLVSSLREKTYANFVLVANKQDQTTALNPARVAQIVGIKDVIGLTALDPNQKENIIKFIKKGI